MNNLDGKKVKINKKYTKLYLFEQRRNHLENIVIDGRTLI
jgi:hypothetical protein